MAEQAAVAGPSTAAAAGVEPAKFSTRTIEQLSKLIFKNEKTKFSNDALHLNGEMLRIYTLEIAHRASKQAQSEGSSTVEPEHIEKILPQLLLDFS